MTTQPQPEQCRYCGQVHETGTPGDLYACRDAMAERVESLTRERDDWKMRANVYKTNADAADERCEEAERRATEAEEKAKGFDAFCAAILATEPHMKTPHPSVEALLDKINESQRRGLLLGRWLPTAGVVRNGSILSALVRDTEEELKS